MAKLQFHAWHAAVAVLAAAAILPLPINGRIADLPSVCMSWNLFGVPCPFCGLTRSFISLGHGKLNEAFAYHPLGPLFFISTAVIVAMGAFKSQWRPSEKILRLVMQICAAMLLVTWIGRLSGFWPRPSY